MLASFVNGGRRFAAPALALLLALAVLLPAGPAAAGSPQPSGVSLVAHTVKLDGRARQVLVGGPDAPRSLIVALHGLTSDGQKMANLTGFHLQAGDHLTLYPNGSFKFGRRGWWEPDIGFLWSLVDWALARWPSIDPNRVYVTGISHGGLMTYQLATLDAAKLAAIAPVAGLMREDHPPANAPLHVYHIHGQRDPLVHIGGEPRLLSMEAGLDYWRGLGGDVQSWVHKGGHIWPPGATAAILKFFAAHPRTP